MRVVNIMLSAGAGGLEAVGFQYARLLAEAGNDSWMICHRKSPYVEAFGEKVIALPNASISNPLAHVRLALALRRLHPDVVFCHGHRAAQFYTPLLRLLLPHSSFIAVCHGANGWRCRKFPRTIAVSEGVRDELVNKWHLDPVCVTTIPNAVPLPDLSDPVKSDPGFLVFGFLGRLDECKGVDILLRAFANLRKLMGSSDPSPRLVIGGSGPEESRLRTLAAELQIDSQIAWLGWVSDKSKFFSQIDVLVMPSREEALGLSMLEAMAHRKSVIVSDCPGPAALVVPTEGSPCGLVVPRDDHQALAGALKTLVEYPNDRDAYAAAGRMLVEKRFSEPVLRDALTCKLR